MTNDEYIAHEAQLCPNCESNDIGAYGHLQADGVSKACTYPQGVTGGAK